MRIGASSPARTLIVGVGRLPALAGRGLVAAYRYTLAPLIGLNCRHLPTCSDYADEALRRFGLWAGGWMTLARLCRCHPWGTSRARLRPGCAAGTGAMVPAVAVWALAGHARRAVAPLAAGPTGPPPISLPRPAALHSAGQSPLTCARSQE